MESAFTRWLKTLRAEARLTNRELARLSDIPESMVTGLQTGSRRAGEVQARKLGRALKLKGEELEEFVLQAINGCTEKVLKQSLPYPAHLLNLIAVQLSKAGIGAENICAFKIEGDPAAQNVCLRLSDGRSAMLTSQLAYA